MKVLVVGANGGTGKRIVQRLVRSEHGVKAVMRRQEDALPLEDVGAETVVANLEYEFGYALRQGARPPFAFGEWQHSSGGRSARSGRGAHPAEHPRQSVRPGFGRYSRVGRFGLTLG